MKYHLLSFFLLNCPYITLTIRNIGNYLFPYIFIGSSSFKAVTCGEAKFSQISRYLRVTPVSEKLIS